MWILKKASDASKISVKEAVRNIEKTLRTRNLVRLLADDSQKRREWQSRAPLRS